MQRKRFSNLFQEMKRNVVFQAGGEAGEIGDNVKISVSGVSIDCGDFRVYSSI